MNGEPLPIGTLLLIVAAGYGSYQGFKHPEYRERLIFSPYAILVRKEYIRLVSSAFLHADWVHFGVNAFTLYSFGGHIEEEFGFPLVALIFFSSVLGGSLLSLWLHRHHDYKALGASGGVCGVLFASIFLLPGGGVMLFMIPFPIPAYLYAVLFVLFSTYGIKAARDNIGHDAHLGGAIIGLLVTTAYRPSIVSQSPVTYVLVVGLSAAAFLYLLRSASTSASFGNPLAALRRFFIDERKEAEPPDDANLDDAVDRILAKISRQGMDSLTDRERRILKSASERRRKN